MTPFLEILQRFNILYCTVTTIFSPMVLAVVALRVTGTVVISD
jgi:hypothetical protein